MEDPTTATVTLKWNVNVNYDNRPVEGATEIDYVLQSGSGWEW